MASSCHLATRKPELRSCQALRGHFGGQRGGGWDLGPESHMTSLPSLLSCMCKHVSIGTFHQLQAPCLRASPFPTRHFDYHSVSACTLCYPWRWSFILSLGCWWCQEEEGNFQVLGGNREHGAKETIVSIPGTSPCSSASWGHVFKAFGGLWACWPILHQPPCEYC